MQRAERARTMLCHPTAVSEILMVLDIMVLY